MCGIIGVISNEEVTPTILGVLGKLEYRGYDSAGLATIQNSRIERRRAKGKIKNLEVLVKEKPLSGHIGIGHTRWATHGAPSKSNAHPHQKGSLVGVHNGIIENFREIKTELESEGYEFDSETDTEVVVQLCAYYLDLGCNIEKAFESTLGRLQGAFALCFMFAEDQDKLFVSRRGAPLVVGYGKSSMFVGSDAVSLSHLIDEVTFLEEDDWAIVERKGINIFNKSGIKTNRAKKRIEKDFGSIGKGNYQHFMLKEMHEQSEVLSYATASFIDYKSSKVEMLEGLDDIKSINRLILVACGTAYYACAVAKYWFEKYAKIPVEIDVASEFRYRDSIFEADDYAIFVSQSGETADTLAALRKVKGKVKKIISIINVMESSIARDSDFVLPIKAGPEIGVASTKAFTSQLAVLASIVIYMANNRGHLSSAENSELIDALMSAPRLISDILTKEEEFKNFSMKLENATSALFLGRGSLYPLALEAALKLKEISYIHAEGYPSGELKHGPIALVDSNMPIICFAPYNNLFEKTISNVEEVLARAGNVLLITDQEGSDRLPQNHLPTIIMPTCHSFIEPIIYALPSQLIAYHAAVIKGTDVDQPRNLAKSVTVE